MKVFVHAGFQRTGSTFLQNCLFSKHPQIQYIGLVNNSLAACSDLQNLYSFIMDKAIKTNKEDMLDCFASLTKDFNPSLPVVMSNESLSVEIEPGRWEGGRMEGRGTRIGVKTKAGSLSLLSDDLKVFFVIRNQPDVIESHYFLYARSYPANYVSFENWYSQMRSHLQTNYNYYQIMKTYADILGTENIKVYLYEELRNDDRRFISDICNYLGVDADKGIEIAAGKIVGSRLTTGQLAYRRMEAKLSLPKTVLGRLWQRVNCFGYRKLASFMGDDRKLSLQFPEDIKAQIESDFAETNKKVGDLFGLDLLKHKYVL